MASEQPQPQPKNNPLFTYFPFLVWGGIVFIALSQNGGLNKLRAMQGATAATDKKAQLVECYAQFGITDAEVIANVRRLDNTSVNNLLFECRQRLNNNGAKKG